MGARRQEHGGNPVAPRLTTFREQGAQGASSSRFEFEDSVPVGGSMENAPCAPCAPSRGGGTWSASARLDTLAHRLERLSPSHRDPERFHLEKDEIAHALRRLAQEVAHG